MFGRRKGYDIEKIVIEIMRNVIEGEDSVTLQDSQVSPSCYSEAFTCFKNIVEFQVVIKCPQTAKCQRNEGKGPDYFLGHSSNQAFVMDNEMDE
jgi:hypothetical protein